MNTPIARTAQLSFSIVADGKEILLSQDDFRAAWTFAEAKGFDNFVELLRFLASLGITQ